MGILAPKHYEAAAIRCTKARSKHPSREVLAAGHYVGLPSRWIKKITLVVWAYVQPQRLFLTLAAAEYGNWPRGSCRQPKRILHRRGAANSHGWPGLKDRLRFGSEIGSGQTALLPTGDDVGSTIRVHIEELHSVGTAKLRVDNMSGPRLTEYAARSEQSKGKEAQQQFGYRLKVTTPRWLKSTRLLVRIQGRHPWLDC